MKMTKCVLAAAIAALVGSGFAAEQLAEGFAPLQWIESTGEQYIDTGVDAGATTTVDMAFGHCVYGNGATFFGKDVWDPKGFLFILQNDHFRFFGNLGKEPGPMWNMYGIDLTEERDYRLVLGKDSKARLFGADGAELCALATDRTTSSHHSLWLFKCDHRHSRPGLFRLYALKLGEDSGKTVRDFVPARRTADRAVGLYDRITQKFFANAGTGAFRASDDPPDPTPKRWSLVKAREWGMKNPWFCGFNHVPANAINDTEIWQRETFSPDVIEREFALAKGLGFNCVRIFIQYKVYEHDPAWFHQAFEKYLQLADAAQLKVMPTLFDDCSFGLATEPTLGKQTDPLVGWNMWGWTPSPGYTMVVDHRTHGRLEKYVKDLIATHKDDPRIFAWDLYNEPVNGMGGYSKYSLALVKKCFKWGREVRPSQPLTVGRWNGNGELNALVARESDIISYHCYGNAQRTRAMIGELSRLGRPMVCTEWFLRYGDCDIEHCLGIYKEKGVGCMMWGLVNGKTQTHLPFGYCANKPPYTGRWKHDLFHNDLTPYNPKELELLKQMTRDKSLPPRPFGTTKYGEQAKAYILRGKGGLVMEVTDYGGRVSRLLVPDAKGELVDVTIGFDSAKGWDATDPFFGAIIGRYGNRIWQGRFTLDGKTYQLDCNDVTRDCHLHGGTRGWYSYVWKAEQFTRGDDVGIVFAKRFPDGEQGFPGNVDAKVTYTITPDNTWRIEYEATTDKATPMNLTQHVYFNLNGTGDVHGQNLQIDADTYVSVDGKLNPLPGAPKPVAGTPFDFRTFHKIGERINAPDRDLRIDPGYDHNFCLNGTGFRKVSEMRGDRRRMEIWTDQPGVQFYSGNLIEPQWRMKDGIPMLPRSHIAMETQHYPNTPNRPDYPQTTLRPGETYRTKTEYRFRPIPAAK